MSESEPEAPKNRFLDRLERLGNALPEPATMFAIGIVVVFVASWIAAASGWNAVLTREGGEVLRDEVAANLLSSQGLRWLAENLVSEFVGFRPLGLVLAMVLGIAVAERSGLVAAGLKAVLLVVPRALLTPATFFVGVMSSLAVDAGFIVLPPLAAAVYRAAGRAPLAGIAVVFAGVASGFNANLLVTGLDPLLAGMTEEAARFLDPKIEVASTCNWYFMAASTVVVTLVGWFVAARFVEPRLALRAPDDGGPDPHHTVDADALSLTADERGGLAWAAGTTAVTLVFLLLNVVSPWGFLYDEPNSGTATWIGVIVPLLVLLFLVPGLAYGIRTGSVRSDKDVVRMMGESMATMSSYIVLAFFAAIFVAAFARSNLGPMLAIEGGLALRAVDLPPSVLMLGFVVVAASVNMLIGSASAKWAMLSTVFVPTFMTVGISPALTQVAYRVGDSFTNCVSPLNPYMVVLLVFMQQESKKAGIGTLVSMMAPFAVALGIVWPTMLFIWVTLGLPLGPGGGLVYTP